RKAVIDTTHHLRGFFCARNARRRAFLKGMHRNAEHPRVLIVSPVRNEAQHVVRVARAVAAQELAPARWIAIDDSSTDATLERLLELEREIDFLSVLRAPQRDTDAGARDRLARAVEVRNFNLALDGVDVSEFTHVMKLDGDIELPAD